jgi:predicted DNA-binding protein (UPF0251 family)
MPRPRKERRVSADVGECLFGPAGLRRGLRGAVTLRCDEAEAVRLADLQGLYQADAAYRMGVSRQTFGRIVESARRKIADAIINRKCLRVEGRRGEGGLNGTAE